MGLCGPPLALERRVLDCCWAGTAGPPAGWGDATGWIQKEDPVVGTWARPAVTAVRVALCVWVKEKKDLEIAQRAFPGLSRCPQ